jgi:hypothetical protein
MLVNLGLRPNVNANDQWNVEADPFLLYVSPCIATQLETRRLFFNLQAATYMTKHRLFACPCVVTKK